MKESIITTDERKYHNDGQKKRTIITTDERKHYLNDG